MNAPAETSTDEGKRVDWAELFFDLVFVIAVTQTSALVRADHGGLGLVRAAVVFVPIYWIWVGTSLLANLNDMGPARWQLRIFAVALAGVFVALALDDAYDGRALLFALAYWIARILLGLDRLDRISPYTLSIYVTGPLLVLGAFLPVGGRTAVWAVAAVLDLAAPTVLRRRLMRTHFDAGHLAERFGLLVLIALGESLVAIVSSVSSHLTVLDGVAVGLAFVVSVGLWWVYFHFSANAVRHSLSTAPVQIDITRIVLSYGHFLFLAAIIAVSVGLHEAVADPGERMSWTAAGLLYGGAALYLATFGLTRWAMFRLVSVTRLTAAGVVLVALPAVGFLPAVLALLLLALILAALNIVEAVRNDRIGWRATLTRRGNAMLER